MLVYPSAFIFRAAFSKGLLVVFDFHKLAQEHGVKKITDIYGKEHWLDDIEVVLSESQFKLAKAYADLSEYNRMCEQTGFGWGVSRYTPKNDKVSTTTTYQYLQSINITKEKIPSICQPTIDWIENVSGLNWKDVLIFLLGEIESFEQADFDQLDYLAKAIMLEPECMKDSFIHKKLLRLLNKKIKESYTGVLKIDGNYQFIISDPYAQAEWLLGLPVVGILNKGYAYSHFWNEVLIDRVSCFRSPMTWRSEHIVLPLDSRENEWYTHLYSGIVMNIYDDWLMRLSGADLDGDIVMTTPLFTTCHYEGLNIPTYHRQTADKVPIKADDLWKSDTLSFGSKIGIITNIETTFFSLLPLFKGTEMEKILINRIKACNIYQNMQIDKTKGITISPLPDWWDKWQKEGTNADVYNTLLARQRPYFFRYVYSEWNKKYTHHLNSYENICIVKFGYNLATLLEKQDLSELEQKVKTDFVKYSPLLDTDCSMNQICHYMEKNVKEIKTNQRNISFDFSIYMNPYIIIDQTKLAQMNELFEKYKSYLRSSYDTTNCLENEEFSRDDYIKVLEKEAYRISSNLSELTNLLIVTCYGHGENSKEFCWKMFGAKGIIENLTKRCRGFIQIPLLDDSGMYQYLGKNYTIESMVINE